MTLRKTLIFIPLAVALALALMLSACSVQATSQPADPATVTSLAFNPTDGSLLKTDAAGLFRLAVEPLTWEPIRTPTRAGLTAVVVNPDDPDTLYVSGSAVGVLKSTDSGDSWHDVNSGLTTTNVSALAMHSFRRETLYAWLKDDGMYRTEDGGAHWNRMPDVGPPDTAVQAMAHSTLPGSMNTGWLYANTPSGAYLSMDCF